MVVTGTEDTHPGGSSVRRPASVLDSACASAPERTGRGPCPPRSAPDSGSSSCKLGWENLSICYSDFEAWQPLNTVMTLNICSLTHTHTQSEISYGTTSIHLLHLSMNSVHLQMSSFYNCINVVFSISSTYSSHCPSVFFLYSSVSKATALASKATGDGHWLVRWAISSCLERKSLFFSTVLQETSCKVG